MSGYKKGDLGSERVAVTTTFAFVICTYILSGIVASIYCRGLYQDGAYYLYRLAERDWFYLFDPARTTVQVMRQAPVVVMLELGDFSLVRLGQVFSLAMLLWPPALVALCWIIAPRDRKVLVLFPAIHLLVGFSTMSFEAVGEGAIAVAYLWVLLFLILFRTRRAWSQVAFLALCAPAFQLHEAACFFTPVLILAIAHRFKTAVTPHERLFLVASAFFITSIFAYQLIWVIYPRIPAEREVAINALLTFGYLYFENHFNLPAVTAVLATMALAGTLLVQEPTARVIGDRSAIIAASFSIYCLAAIATAWLVEASLSPPAQSLSRFNPVFASLVLGLLVTFYAKPSAGPMPWARGPTLAIVISLSVTQLATDLAATKRWGEYIVDFENRLAASRGLVDWRGGRADGDDRRDRDWRLMTVGWVHPIMSIILASDGNVHSILDYPPTATFRPIEPSDPDRLPAMHGVSYESYRQILDVDHRSR